MDNILQERIAEITCTFAKNFVIHDITDKSIAVVNAVQCLYKRMFVMFGVITDSKWARAIKNDEVVNSYLNANNLTWYYAFDPQSHITLIYIVEKGQEPER